MIPAPDFRIEIVIDIAEEVLRMGFAVIGFAIACWAVVKIVGIIGKANERTNSTDIEAGN